MARETINVASPGSAAKAVSTETIRTDFIATPPPPKQVSKPRKTPDIIPPRVRVLTFATHDRPPFGKRSRIQQQEYDLVEIGKATDTDALLRAAFDRHLTCIMKEGWSIQARNPAVVEYLHRRLEEIEFMTDLPFDMVLRQCAQDLIEFGNFFLYLFRQTMKSGGQPIRWHGKNVEAISALYPVDPATMFPKVGETLEIRSWHQFINEHGFSGRRFASAVHSTGVHGLRTGVEDTSEGRRYRPEDIIHGYWRRRTGFIFGTPTAVPVLDDIKALRRLEEVAELVAHKHGFPLLHIQVGTEEIPARRLVDGTPEVDAVRDEYDTLPLEGAFVTSERVSVEAIKPDAMEFTKLLEHFHNRAMAGLGISDMDIGRGGTANRATAAVLSRNLMDRCREYQKILSDFLSYKLFVPLLMEGGFDLNLDNRATLIFPDVDVERQMAINNHALALYQSDLVTESEAREIMGRDALEDARREDMHLNRVAIPLAKAQAQAKLQATLGAAAVRNQPTNQSGTKSSKTSTTANTPRVSGEPRRRRSDMQTLSELLDSLRTELHDYVSQQEAKTGVIDNRELSRRFESVQPLILDELDHITRPWIQGGMDRYAKDSDSGKTFYVGEAVRKRFSRRCLVPPLSELVSVEPDTQSDARRMVDSLRESPGDYHLALAGMFDLWASRWERLLDRLELIAQEYGYAQAAWIDGSHDVQWVWDDEPCPTCREVRSDNLTPAQTHYYGLMPRDCAAKLELVHTDRLPTRVDLEVTGTAGKQITFGVPGHPEYLQLTNSNRFLRILLDSGQEAVLPEDNSEGWSYDGQGTVHLPTAESGVAELWDGDKVVGRARFTCLNGRS